MSKRILVVDDEADTNTALHEILEQNGFIVDSYEDPFLALENFKPNFYDLLILDIKMPEMSGFSFYREIKRLDDKMKYMGSYSDIFSSLPANCFIRKPITNDELLEHIDRIMYGGRE